MTSYRDMTFCPGHGCDHFTTCRRALTEEVWREAGEQGLPVSHYAEPERLDCYDPKPPEDISGVQPPQGR